MNWIPCLECKGVNKWFGPARVLHDINLTIAAGEIVALVGPSGCGKTTLLRAILGTHPPSTGEILIHQESGQAVPVAGPTRDVGIVYQRYSLFPNLTAQENVALGLMLDQTSIPFRLFQPFAWRALRRIHLEEAAALLEKVGLTQAIRRYPSQMSGGMCQRVAIAQALIMKPRLLLLDEPFGALDEAIREELQLMLLKLYQENLQASREGRTPDYTIMIVTHELKEAIYVSDRVLGLSQFWDWRAAGHTQSPGATIIYDHMAPVYAPDQKPDFTSFAAQKDEIRRIAFDPASRTNPSEHVQFWQEVRDGKAQGVFQ